MPSPHLALRLTRGVGAAIGTVLLFVVMIALSAIAQLNAPVIRRVAIVRVNQLVFTPLFQGQLTILSIGHLDAFGVSEASARIGDATGRPVLLAEGLTARFGTLTLLQSLVWGKGDVVIDLPDVSLRQVDVLLDMNDAGLALANAFLPKTPSTKPSTPPDGHGVHVYIPHIHIKHVWGHGQMVGLPYFDADVGPLEAAFSLLPERLSVDVRKGSLVARGIALGADAAGTFSGNFTLGMGLAANKGMGGHFTWEGSAAELHETAKAALENGRFDATLDLREASPEAIRSLWPSSPITGTGTAHLEAHGPIDAVDVTVHAGLDAATVDIRGQLGWGEEKNAKIHIDADAIDVHQFAPTAGVSLLGLKGDFQVKLGPDGRLNGNADVDFEGGKVGELPVPSVSLRTNGFRGPGPSFGGDATILIKEPGAPITVELHAIPHGQSSKIEFSVASGDVRLGAVRRLSAEATGNAQVQGKGSLDLDDLALDAAVDTKGEGIAHGPLRVQKLALHARGRGHLLNPEVDLMIHAEGVRAGTLSFSLLDVRAHGRAMTPHVTIHEESRDLPTLDADLDVDILGGPLFRGADLTLQRNGVRARVRVARARFADADLAVDGIEIDGLGTPVKASFEMADKTLRLKTQVEALDVVRIAKLMNVEDLVRGGILKVDADVSLRKANAEGRVFVALDHGVVDSVEGISAHIDGRMHERRFVGTAHIDAGDIASVDLDLKNLGIGGDGALAGSSWKKAWGDVTLKGTVDLAKLTAGLPVGTLPFSALRGQVDIQGSLERDDVNDFTPQLELLATTSNLFVSGKSKGTNPLPRGVEEPPPWTIRGVDTTVSVNINGNTGALDFTAHVRDAKGELVNLEVKSGAFPYRTLYAAPAEIVGMLPSIGFDAHLVLPSRTVASWPAWIPRPPVDGKLQANLMVKGPLIAPHVDFTAKMGEVDSTLAHITSPLELDVQGTYDSGLADIKVRGVAASHDVLTAEAHALVQAKDILAGQPDLPWKASAKAHVDGFPLVDIGPLDDRQIRGRLSGDLHVDDLHSDAKAEATLTVAKMRIGDVAYRGASVKLQADGHNIDAEVRLDQDDGFGAVKARLAAKWGALLVPQPDPTQPLDVTLETKHFRAAAILPFLRGTVDELDGFIDANARASLDPRSNETKVDGVVSLTHGLFELGSFGGELHDVAATLTITPDGQVTLKDMTASGISGHILASASARLRGLHLETARAIVKIPKGSPFPLTVNGSQLGMIDGDLDITEALSADRRKIDVKVNIPTLHVLLPESSSQNVQPLGVIPNVVIGRREQPNGDLILVPLDAAAEPVTVAAARPQDAVEIRVVTNLGDNVSIRRGSDLRVELTGGPTITIDDKTHVTGQIRLQGGVLDIYGKTFEIEKGGTVTFVGDDPSNPQVSVTASWTAPEARVMADFIGPLKTGKVNLRSEPSLPKNDIIQLLLFGSTDGQQAPGQGTPGTSSAAGVAGGVAAQPLNRALDQFGLSAVSAKIDTTSVNPKPEVEVQIARSLSIKLAVVLGTPPPGSNPDTTLLTLDWRFLRKLSLDTTVGNLGSTIFDLVWQHRY